MSTNVSEDLKIIYRINTVQNLEEKTFKMSFDPKKKYPKLFEDLGKAKPKYKIRLREDVKSVAMSTAR